MSEAPPPIPPGLPLGVTLTAAQWRSVLEQLGNGPFRVVGPLIGEIERQANAQVGEYVARVRGNGADVERSDARQ